MLEKQEQTFVLLENRKSYAYLFISHLLFKVPSNKTNNGNEVGQHVPLHGQGAHAGALSGLGGKTALPIVNCYSVGWSGQGGYNTGEQTDLHSARSLQSVVGIGSGNSGSGNYWLRKVRLREASAPETCAPNKYWLRAPVGRNPYKTLGR